MAEILVGTATGTVNGTSGADAFRSSKNGFIDNGPILAGGEGNDTYYIGAGTKVVELANGGYDTIVSTVSMVMPNNVEKLHLLNGSAGFGNDGDNVIAGDGGSLIDGGRGNDYLVGGGGSTVFQVSAASGHDTIIDWTAGNALRLAGYSQFHNLAEIKASMTQSGGDVVFELDASNSVTFQNTKIANFYEGNFQYRFDPSALTLSFNDDFNSFSARTSRADTSAIWSTEMGDSRGYDAVSSRTLSNNNEQQIYVDTNMKDARGNAVTVNPFSVENGVLSITAQHTPEGMKGAFHNFDFTSGYISTRDTFSQTYGYFEARMQLPAEAGTWPAFWLFRKDGYWPPELDIMEAWNDTTAVQTMHSSDTEGHRMSSARSWVPDGDTNFHDYGFLWTAEKLTWYLDGVEVFSQATPADMHSPMYMVLNLAITTSATNPNFHEQLKVDFVHAYSLGDLPDGVGVVGPGNAALNASLASANEAANPYMGPVEGMFNGLNLAYYAEHNPDVLRSGMDLAQHYRYHGFAEGRLPYEGAKAPYWGPSKDMPEGFNELYYLSRNSDVAASGMDPFHHYTVYGKAEGRLPYDTTYQLTNAGWGKVEGMPDGLNLDYYASHNTDLLLAHVDLVQHYLLHGKAEGRLPFDPSAPTVLAGLALPGPIVTPTPTAPVVTPTPTSTAPVTPTPAPTPTETVPPTPVVTPTPTAPVVTPTPTPTAPVTPTPAPTPTETVPPTPVVTPTPTPTSTGTLTPATTLFLGAKAGAPDGFNATYYTAHNPDVVATGMDPLSHWLNYGRAEGRLPYEGGKPYQIDMGAKAGMPDGFNAAYYAEHNPDVVASGMNMLDHWLRYGKAEGRLAYDPADQLNNPAPAGWSAVAGSPGGFNAAYYAAHNADVVAAGVDLLEHWLKNGKAEGRLGYDDGSGREDLVGTSGNDHLVISNGVVRLITGGAGADTFSFSKGVGMEVITDFDIREDHLDVSGLVAAYGAPTISDLAWASGSMMRFAGGETVVMLGVNAHDAGLIPLV